MYRNLYMLNTRFYIDNIYLLKNTLCSLKHYASTFSLMSSNFSTISLKQLEKLHCITFKDFKSIRCYQKLAHDTATQQQQVNNTPTQL